MDRMLKNLGIFEGQYIENQAISILQTSIYYMNYKFELLINRRFFLRYFGYKSCLNFYCFS